jgi:hypothetical protein
MPVKIALIAFLILAGIVALLFALGRLRWRVSSKKLRAQLKAARHPVEVTAFTTRDLDPLPAPVQRYFRAALVGESAGDCARPWGRVDALGSAVFGIMSHAMACECHWKARLRGSLRPELRPIGAGKSPS